jgi:signal transduction histidine kinase
MKLLARTSRSYILVSAFVFIVIGIAFYYILHGIFKRQLDETLVEEKLLIEQTINYSDSVPDFRLVFAHMIDVTILNTPQKKREYIHDTLMYDVELGSFASFRHLFAENTSYRNKGYTINIYKPLRESESLIAEIVIYLAISFLLLLLLLVTVNYFIARGVWIPFYRTLHHLGKYDINQEAPLELVKTGVHEFNLLNQALGKMAKKIRADFLTLKEFNENAAHELQTPLAIVKSKLELLVQDESLDESRLRLISAASEATTRMSKLIQGLLLISRIENNQFLHTEKINLEQLIEKSLGHFQEMTGHRQIRVSKDYQSPVTLTMNPALAEICINNLLSNAIRHNIREGMIDIQVAEESLTITNTGQILRTESARMFERFRKSESHPDSVGLGLSIVRKICDLYRMRVDYSHRDGIHTLTIFFRKDPAPEFPQNP